MIIDISIIIPVYNHGNHIIQALEHIEKQKGLSHEIIIIDDASTDDSHVILQNWLKNNFSAKYTLLRNPERQYPLKCRIQGVKLAQAQYILFHDADDLLLGTGNIAKILRAQKETGADIAHFRTLGMSNGVMLGEDVWAAPMKEGRLTGREIIESFIKCTYPPGAVWGKIFARALIEHSLPALEKATAGGLEDNFMVTILMMHAYSYLGCGEYAYVYRHPEFLGLEKYARRLKGELSYAPIFRDEMKKCGISPDIADVFWRKYEELAAWDAGKFSIGMEELFFDGMDPDIALERYSTFMNDDELFNAMLLGTASNTSKLIDIVKTYYGFEK